MRSTHTVLTVAPVLSNTSPTLLVAPYTRVLASPALSPRMVPISKPPLTHRIAPENDDPIPRRRYPLRLRPRISLSERGPLLIATAAKFSTAAEFPLTALTGHLFSYATYFLLAVKQHRHRESSAVINEITGTSLEYFHLVRGPKKNVWIRAFSNYLGRLAQDVGMRMPAGINTVFLVNNSGIP